MACSTTSRTGKDGNVVVADQRIARITSWEFDESIGETAWGDSDSGDYTNRAGGRKDGAVSFEGKFDTGKKIYNLMRVGDKVSLVLWETDSDYWDLPCVLIQSFKVSYDVDTKEVVGWEATAAPDGVFYAPGEAGATTRTLPSL